MRLSYFVTLWKDISLEKTIKLVKAEGRRKRGSPNFIKEATVFGLQNLIIAVKYRPFWRTLIPRVARSQK